MDKETITLRYTYTVESSVEIEVEGIISQQDLKKAFYQAAMPSGGIYVDGSIALDEDDFWDAVEESELVFTELAYDNDITLNGWSSRDVAVLMASEGIKLDPAEADYVRDKAFKYFNLPNKEVVKRVKRYLEELREG